MRVFSRLWLAVAVVAFMGVGTTAAQASSVNSFIDISGESWANSAVDGSAEYISTGGSDINAVDPDYTLTEDSVIRGMFQIRSLNDVSGDGINLGGTTGNNQWTGVFSLAVESISEDPTSTSPQTGNPRHLITFGADPNFEGWLSNVHGYVGQDDSTSSNPMVEGTAIRMFESSDITYDRTAHDNDPDRNVATATEGDFFWDMGFGERGADWAIEAELVADPDTPSGWSISNLGNFALTLMQEEGLDDDIFFQSTEVNGQLVDFIGNTQVFGGSQLKDAGFHARNTADFNFTATPSPTAGLAGLFAFGLMGAGYRRRTGEQAAA